MKELPDNERPRERLISYGASSLSDSQLLAILLRNGYHNKNVFDLALEILKTYPLAKIQECSYYDLVSIKGVGKVKAIEILAAIELGKRIFLREKEALVKLQSAKDIWKDVRYFITDVKQEYFYCYYFNHKQELLERKLCIHNHPSNCVMPSKEDILLTDHLVKTGYIQGIPIQDHIIVGEDSYYSFYEHHNILNL